MAMLPDYKATEWFNSCELEEKIKVEMLVEMQKTQGDNKALVSVPEAAGQNEEVEPRIEMVEEVKEAADFMNENDAPTENLVLKNNHPPEEEKKANSSNSQSDEDSGFDVDLSVEDVINEDEEQKIEKLIEMQKTQEDNEALAIVPEAAGQNEEVEPQIEMVEEQKEAADFMIENEAAPENPPREINQPPEEEKKGNINESQSSSDSGFNVDLTIQDIRRENVELKTGETEET